MRVTGTTSCGRTVAVTIACGGPTGRRGTRVSRPVPRGDRATPGRANSTEGRQSSLSANRASYSSTGSIWMEIFGVHRRQPGNGALCHEASVPITVSSFSCNAALRPP